MSKIQTATSSSCERSFPAPLDSGQRGAAQLSADPSGGESQVMGSSPTESIDADLEIESGSNAEPFVSALACHAAVLLIVLLALAATPARAGHFSLEASGTISTNGSGDSTIAIATPWTFEITYDTAAPDLDFELTGSPDSTFGRFTNTAAPPALTSFHFQAGSYEVAIDDPADFGTGSVIDTTFTTVHAIDINVFAPALFPPLAGGAVSFHADFNDFSSDPIFVSDALPTNTARGPGIFDASTVNLQVLGPPSGVVGSSSVESLTVTAVPEPLNAALAIVGFFVLFGAGTALRPRPRIRDARIPRQPASVGE